MTETNPLPSGTNLKILLQNCHCSSDYLTKPESVVDPIEQIIKDSDLTPLCHTSYNFHDSGYTIAFILAESHVVIHTWEEYNQLVLIEVSVCDFRRENRQRTLTLGQNLSSFYKAEQFVHETAPMIPRISDLFKTGHGYYVEINSLLEMRQSAFQSILVANTPVFGKMLVLDGVIQVSELDDSFYHEPLVHVPMLSHPEPKHVLICGGGDGGAAKEVLRHPSVQTCTIVDIDPDVVSFSKKHLSSIHQGALDNPKVTVEIGDATQFIKQTRNRYDVVILDSTDPTSNDGVLFTKEFYTDVRDSLTDEGYVSLHVGAPLCIEEVSKRVYSTFHAVFPQSLPFLQFVPSYATVMGFVLGHKKEAQLLSKELVGGRVRSRSLESLEVVTPDTFHAMFAIPPRVKNVLSD